MLKKVFLGTTMLFGVLMGTTGYAYADPVTIGSVIISTFLNTGLGALLPTASAAAIGSGVLAAGQLALSIGGALFNKPKAPPPGTVKQTITAEETPAFYVNGRADFPTVLVAPFYQHPYIYRPLAHAQGPIDYVETYYINGREVVVGETGLVLTPPYIGWSYSGTEGVILTTSSITILEKNADPDDVVWEELNTPLPLLWTTDHVLPDIVQTLMIITNPGLANPEEYQKLFSAGPELQLTKRGRGAPIYDPRLDSTNGGSGSHRVDDRDTWEWTENGVLNAVDIHRKINKHFTSAKYDWALIAEQADKADVEVTIPGGTEPRSRFGGAWEATGSKSDTFQEVMDSVGVERRITADNKYWFELIDDVREAEIEFTADDGYRVTWAPGPKAIERPNIARVKYLSPERNYKIEELPLHRYDTGANEYVGAAWARYQAEIDVYGEKPFSREYPYCPSPYQAQRNLRREFAMARGDLGELSADMSGWAAWGCHIASIEIDNEPHVCLIDSPRGNDEPGEVNIPFTVIPPLAPMVADDYVPPPPEVVEIPIDSDIENPLAPSAALQITYPDASKEVRMEMPDRSGASRYFPIMREYTEYPNRPERWQVMNCVEGLRIGYLAGDYLGDPLDFKYLCANGDDFTDYGPELNVTSLAANNTACGAPTLSNPVYDTGGGGGP